MRIRGLLVLGLLLLTSSFGFQGSSALAQEEPAKAPEQAPPSGQQNYLSLMPCSPDELKFVVMKDGTADYQQIPQFVEEPPRPIEEVRPIYPRKLLKKKIEGTVVLRVVVCEDGTIDPRTQMMKVLRATNDKFVRAAIEAAKATRMTIPRFDGKPVKTFFTFTYRFKLSKEE